MSQLQTRKVNSEDQSPGALPHLCSPNALLLLVIVGELLALLLALAERGVGDLSWAHLGLVSFLLQWIVLTSAVILCRLQPVLRRLSPLWAGLCGYLLILLCTFVFTALGQWLLKGLGRGFIDWEEVLTHVLIAAVLGGVVLRYLYLQQQLYLQKQAELRSRIQALQARIEPHFLFNSLNSIASLIAVDAPLAERQVEDLSDLLRASLAEPALISAERELALCLSYVHIEQARLGERLRLSWSVEPLPGEALLPNLALQPLVENAIRYGVDPAPEGGEVSVHARQKSDELVVHISNSLPDAQTAEREAGNRMALDNIRHRLAAHFGEAAELAVEPGDTRYTVTLTVALKACRQRTP